MKYLQYKRHLLLILGVDRKGIVIFFDSSRAVYADMRSHIGLFATMGKGTVMSSNTNRIKFNTRSFTKTKFVDVSRKLLKCIWFQYYCKVQNVYVNKDILDQDNKSSLENN